MSDKLVSSIKIINGALDEDGKGNIVLRGVVDPTSLPYLQVADYQRDEMSREDIQRALKDGDPLPDIELGMRGGNYTTREGSFWLKDPVFTIDGWQRVTTTRKYLEVNPDASIRNIGATIYFNTTEEWERERFAALNTLRARVSPNVLLRNRRNTSGAVLMLYGLSTNDRNFVMHDRIAWRQNMAKGELISALSLAKVVGTLHSHKAPGRLKSVGELVPALDRMVELIGIQIIRENLKAFFDLVDQCWGIKRIEYRGGAPYIKASFLNVLAAVISDHHDFWRQPDEKRLFVEAPLKRKFAQFPVNDPQVVNLSGTGGKSQEILYILLRDHINKGKTTKRLISRNGDHVSLDQEDADEAA